MKWFLILNAVHAITWRSFCERWLIAPDPYDFEDQRTDYVMRAYLSTGAQAYWTKRPSSELRVLGDELRKREQTDEVKDLLEKYQMWEYRP